VNEEECKELLWSMWCECCEMAGKDPVEMLEAFEMGYNKIIEEEDNGR